MRHRKKGRKFNRTSSHRKALMRNMAISFIRYGTIRTTVPKAKELRSFVEPLITLAKVDNLAKRRRAFSLLGNKDSVGKLFSTTAKICLDRPGGYLSVLKAGIRPGDNAPLALIRLVGAPENYAEQGNERPATESSNKNLAKPAKDTKSKDAKSDDTKSSAKSAGNADVPAKDETKQERATDEASTK